MLPLPSTMNNNDKTTRSSSKSVAVIPLLMSASNAPPYHYHHQYPQSRVSCIERLFFLVLFLAVICFQLAIHVTYQENSRMKQIQLQEQQQQQQQQPRQENVEGSSTISNSNVEIKAEKNMKSMATDTTKTTTEVTVPAPAPAPVIATSPFPRKDNPYIPSNHYRYADVCPNIKSTHYAFDASAPLKSHNMMDPKIPVDGGQRFIARGGYEEIAKGSGPIHAAGPIINLLSKVQHTEFGMFGTVGELGVHHGRFTSFLFTTARKVEKLVVVDLFEDLQELNVDMSGLGDFQRFSAGLTKYGLEESDLHFVHKGSTDQIPFNWADENGFEAFRLVSVDAGHTAFLTFNDLQLTFCNLVKGGIVILDDWFHPRWPGVVEGFYEFSSYYRYPQANATYEIEVYPFLLCESKLYVTNDKDYHHVYMKRLLNDPSSLHEWMSPYAHESSRIADKKWFYEMNGGIPYLRCDSTRLPSDHKVTQDIWLDRLY